MVPVGILDSTDHILPVGAFSTPANGSTVSGLINLFVNVSDNDSVASVQFKVDGNNIGGPVTGPFQINGYDTRPLGNGAHSFTAVVKDRVGNQTTLTSNVTVNNVPTISITSPGSGATVGGVITLSASVSSFGGAATVQWNIDGANVGGALGAPYQLSYDTHNLANGGHTIYATVRDPQGNQVQASVGVTVSNGIAGGLLYFGGWAPWNDDEQAYDSYRNVGPDYNNRWNVNAIWDNFGNNINTYHGLPGNPDPTHYQMRVQMGTTNAGRCEGGTSGNDIHVTLDVNGVEYDAWDNGPTWGPFRSGPAVNVNGGEGVRMAKWETISGMNTSFTQGCCVYYDYIPKMAS
jgi:hypothetical protein